MLIYSVYMDNIPSEVVRAQRRVVQKLMSLDGFDVFEQVHLCGRQPDDQHGATLDEAWSDGEHDTVLFMDIDAIPLDTRIMVSACVFAADDELFGIHARSAHIPGTGAYVHPAFLACSRALWLELGKPSFRPEPGKWDTGGAFTAAAIERGVPIRRLMPESCERLAPWSYDGVGIGTTFGSEALGRVYHMAEARNGNQSDIDYFLQKCEEVAPTAGAAE